MSATIGSLFSGIGGLELGLEMCGLGPVIWQCDSDPYARAVLEAHWPGVKRYDDVRSIDAKTERPTIICGGFPCQPVSVAGKRKAQRDTRWLWPHFSAAIAAVRPAFVFVENVPGLRGAGLRDVLADLASLGFDAEWGDFSAEEVGAPHRRKRIFLVAHPVREPGRLQQGRRGRQNREGAPVTGDDGGQGSMADAVGLTGGTRRSRHSDEGQGGRDAGRSRVGSDAMANANGEGELQQGGSLGAQRGWSLDGRRSWPPEPDVGRVAHGVPARTHRLRLLGNACVPAQAALAWRTLTARLQPPTLPE